MTAVKRRFDIGTRRRVGWLSVYGLLASTLLAFAFGIGFFIVGGVMAPLSDSTGILTALFLVPVVSAVNRLHGNSDERSTTVGWLGYSSAVLHGVGSFALVLGNTLVPALTLGGFLAVQFLGIGLQGLWLIGIGVIGLDANMLPRRTSFAGIGAGLGYVATITGLSMRLPFQHPVILGGGLLSLVGIMLWAIWLAADLRSGDQGANESNDVPDGITADSTEATKRYRRIEQRWWDSLNLQPTEQMIHLRRLDVDVRVQEVGDGAPLLFVHGGPSTGSEWLPMLPGLVDDYRCLLLDRPGTGLSDTIERDVDVQELGDALVVDVLDALAIDRADLVVSSLGGYIAIRTAAAFPNRVGRTVQMGCPGAVPGMTVPLFMRLMAAPVFGSLVQRLPPNERSTEWILRQIGHGISLDAGKFSDEMLAWSLSFARDTETMVNEQAVVSEVMSVRGVDPSVTISEETFRVVESPTYFFWGEEDPFGDERIARRTVARLSNAELELVPDAGHLPWLDEPDRAMAITREFLQG